MGSFVLTATKDNQVLSHVQLQYKPSEGPQVWDLNKKPWTFTLEQTEQVLKEAFQQLYPAALKLVLSMYLENSPENETSKKSLLKKIRHELIEEHGKTNRTIEASDLRLRKPAESAELISSILKAYAAQNRYMLNTSSHTNHNNSESNSMHNSSVHSSTNTIVIKLEDWKPTTTAQTKTLLVGKEGELGPQDAAGNRQWQPEICTDTGKYHFTKEEQSDLLKKGAKLYTMRWSTDPRRKGQFDFEAISPDSLNNKAQNSSLTPLIPPLSIDANKPNANDKNDTEIEPTCKKMKWSNSPNNKNSTGK